MVWIQTIPWSKASEELRRAIETQRDLYPEEYELPVEFPSGAEESVVSSHSLIPDALYHAFATFGVLMVAQTTADTATARDDYDRCLSHKSLFLLNCVSRRVSASNNFGR